MGLPGSGKTHLGNELAKAGAKFIDDAGMLLSMPAIENEHVVLADVFLCDPVTRAKAEKKLKELGCELEWVYFENDPDKCRANVKHRNDGRKVDEMIRQMTRVYEVPSMYEGRSIWQSEKS